MDIGWTLISHNLELLYDVPENLVSRVRNSYDNDSTNGNIKNCLGVQDLWGSVYELKVPFD